jgi:hypothetical protein
MFYSGEAILALFELYQKTKNTSIYDAALSAQTYYLYQYVNNISTSFHPAYVPWHTQTLFHFYNETKNETYASAVFAMNNNLVKMQQRTNKSTIGRFYDPIHKIYGPIHSSSDALYTEGLVYAYQLADACDRTDLKQQYQTAFLLGAYRLKSLQYTDYSNTETFGGIKYSSDDPRIRVDSVSHGIECVTAIKNVLAGQKHWKFTFDVSQTSDYLITSK